VLATPALQGLAFIRQEVAGLKKVEIRREDGSLLCKADHANRPISRMKGLLGRKGLEVGTGLLLDPCNSVHMVFMRFPIDVIYLDKQGAVVKAVPNLKPYRFSAGGRRAKRTLEVPTGTIEQAGLLPGERLSVA
jgi:uncharacterized protein